MKSKHQIANRNHRKKQQKVNSFFVPITEDEEKISLTTEPVDADLLTLDIGKASLNSDEVVEVLDESAISEALRLNGDQSSESIEGSAPISGLSETVVD